MAIKIIGIDPAPGKGSTVFDRIGSPRKLSHKELYFYLEELKALAEPVLVCWDSPLTSLQNPLSYGNYYKGDFTQRPIESYFSRLVPKLPKGVTVGGYATLQHWTLSRHLLGLPIMGKYDRNADELDFKLIQNSSELAHSEVISQNLKCIVEVHPALAMHFWLGNLQKYKGKTNKDTLNGIWHQLLNIKLFNELRCEPPKDDDELDAIVAWVLGNEWVNNVEPSVRLMGNKLTGSMLLPSNNDYFLGFENFISKYHKQIK